MTIPSEKLSYITTPTTPWHFNVKGVLEILEELGIIDQIWTVFIGYNRELTELLNRKM